jgi:hypothetical protein
MNLNRKGEETKVLQGAHLYEFLVNSPVDGISPELQCEGHRTVFAMSVVSCCPQK